MDRDDARTMGRRRFLGSTLKGGAGLAFVGGLSGLLAACGSDDSPGAATTPGGEVTRATPGGAAVGTTAPAGGQAINGDVIDFALSSDDWPGAFGFVTLRLHRGLVDGAQVSFIRTDASDEAYAEQEGLVFVPKIAVLDDPERSGAMYVVEGGVADQPVVLSSEPGRDDFTPAWRLHTVRFTGEPAPLGSVADVEAASASGAAEVDATGTVVNAALVTWSTGELAVDDELASYLGGGQLIEPADVEGGRVTFELHECFPGSRYIVTDHSIAMAANMTSTALAPRLQAGPSDAGATGRTNVFMNGIEGSGPMGFQPSAFDLDAGDAGWSPYWDHFTYAWNDGVDPRVLRSQTEVHAARDAGELTEFPGTPDTDGTVFTVNCPVPVLAQATFGA